MLIIGKASDLKYGDDFLIEAYDGRGVSGQFQGFVRADADVTPAMEDYFKTTDFLDIRYILERCFPDDRTFLFYHDGSEYRHAFIDDTIPAAIVRSI